jgi:hypothetical protein
MFGGFNVFGTGAKIQKTFTGLPAHNTIIVRMQFWKIDSWDNEVGYLYLDGAVIWQ